MIQKLTLGVLLAGTCFAAMWITGGETQASVPGAIANNVIHEPLVIYDVSGGTLSGPVHQHVAIYNDGFISYSSVSGLGTQIVEAWTSHATQEEVRNLLRSLNQDGAFSLSDQPLAVTDVPLKTITVLRGNTAAVANTFSYWLAVGDYSGASQSLGDFIQAHTP